MVNLIQKNRVQLNNVYVCLSTDTKPTTDVTNGDMAIEMDTGKVYFYNASGSAWVEFAQS